MPRKARRGRAKARRPRRNYRRKTVAKPLSLGPKMPNSIIAKHKFTKSFTLTEANNSPNSFGGQGKNNMFTFRLNSVYDPTVGGIAGSDNASFYTDMANFYTTYRVIGAKVWLKFINLGQEPIYIGMHKGGSQQTSSTIGIDYSQWKQLRNSSTCVLHGMNTGPKSVRLLTQTYSPESVEGKSKAVVRGDPNFESLVGQNPGEPHYLSIGATQINSTNAAADMAVQVEATIMFTAIWNDRKIDYPAGGQ